MHAVRIAIGFAVAGLFTLLLIRNVDLGEAARAAALVGPNVLGASVVLVLVGYSVRAWRWQIMLKGAGVAATYRQAASIFFAAFALSNVLPLRAGDVYRCASTAHLPGGTIARSLATLLTERVLDLIALTVLLSALLFLFPSANLAWPSLPIAASLTVGFVLLIVLVSFPVAVGHLVEVVMMRSFAREGTAAKIAKWIGALTTAIEGTLSGNSLFNVGGLTAMAWLLELGAFILVGSALSGNFVVVGGLYAGVLGTLATLIPGAPGHFGTFDFFAAQGFRISGLGAENALAAALVCHVAILVPVTLLGSLHLIAERQTDPDVL